MAEDFEKQAKKFRKPCKIITKNPEKMAEN